MVSFLTTLLVIYSLINNVLCCTFEVLSVDHAQGPNSEGKYFNFMIAEIDGMLGRTDWTNSNFNVYNERTKQVKTVILWRSANGGSIGDGHGRENDGTAAAGDFQTGDIVSIIGIDLVCQPNKLCNLDILSIDHSSGKVGQYFNFDISEVDGILGRTTWQSENFNVYNSRTKKITKVILWRGANGGSDGDAHGREDDGTAAPGDFQVTDQISFVGIECQKPCSHLAPCLKRRLRKIEGRLDAVEGTTNPAMRAQQNFIPFEPHNNGLDVLVSNKDLILLMSLLINVLVLSISLILCCKLMKSNKYSKVLSYTSSDE